MGVIRRDAILANDGIAALPTAHRVPPLAGTGRARLRRGRRGGIARLSRSLSGGRPWHADAVPVAEPQARAGAAVPAPELGEAEGAVLVDDALLRCACGGGNTQVGMPSVRCLPRPR